MLKNSNIIFDKENHTYKLGDDYLQGITGLLNKHLFPNKYAKVPSEILKKAASKGSFIHECCELVDTLGIIPNVLEAQNYIKLKEKNNLTTIANEYLVTDCKNFASAIDVVLDDYSLADIKTTAEFDSEYVSWQLSIYAYLFELQNPTLKVNKLFGIWLRDTTAELIQVDKISSELVKELLQCELDNKLFVNPLVKKIPDKVFILEEELINLDTQFKEIDIKKKALLESLLDEMEAENADKWETSRIRLTRRKATLTERFDSKSFKEVNPDLYSQFVKISPVKSSITFKAL